ncbi:unnamed protein product [Arctogadus glacialis]
MGRPRASLPPSGSYRYDQQNQNSGLVLVVDHAEYKKYGSRQTVAARMLAVVNHVDKLYRSLGIRVMLVGLEIWTYGDQIEVSPDPNVTLERFMDWRRQTLLPRTKHDNAQFITNVDFIGNTVGLAYTWCNMYRPFCGRQRGREPSFQHIEAETRARPHRLTLPTEWYSAERLTHEERAEPFVGWLSPPGS